MGNASLFGRKFRTHENNLFRKRVRRGHSSMSTIASMRDSMFDPWELLTDLKNRWPVVAVSCGLALVFALGASALLPKRYTATAEVLIQVPGSNDPRAATAISPVYLESLKSYERLASSDTLFVRALDHVHASAGSSGHSIESLKKSILHVSKLANTAVLEISATMTDPKQAQALAQYVAEQTVQASLSMDVQTETEMTREFRSQLDAAVKRVAEVRQAQAHLSSSEPVDSMESQMKNTAELKLDIEKELAQTQTELAGYLAETPTAGNDRESQRMVASARARAANLIAQQRDLAGLLLQQGAKAQQWKDQREAVQAERDAAQTAFETASTRFNDSVTAARYRGERLRMIDPGIVPQEPVSPNVPLNVLASLVLALVGSLVYLMTTFSYHRAKRVRVTARTEPAFSFRG
jgi:capsular polysaccharide biosynthesis protein